MGWCIYGWLRVLAWFIVIKRRAAAAGAGGAAGRCMEWVATQDIAKMDGIINYPRSEELKYSEL